MLLRLITPIASMTENVRQQERTANNLANVNTVGYRRQRSFTEALSERLDAENAPRSDRSITQWADQQQGTLESTGNPLDVAIKANGLFVYTDTTTGTQRYSRAGNLVVGNDGILRSPSGDTIQGEQGPIRLPSRTADIEISQEGVVEADGRQIGRLQVVQFANPELLQRTDGSMFEANGQQPQPVTNPEILQGFVEGSNVNPLQEMSDMIVQFRFFESQQKMVHSTDQLLGEVTRDLGKF